MAVTREKAQLMTASEIDRTLVRLAHEILERAQDPDKLVFIGIRRRGVPLAQRLSKKIEALEQRKIPVVLMGLLAPPNLGVEYRGKFDAIYPALAEKHHVSLVPFFLKAVFDKPDLIQPDHIHPTARGIEEIVAATTYAVEGELTPGAN